MVIVEDDAVDAATCCKLEDSMGRLDRRKFNAFCQWLLKPEAQRRRFQSCHLRQKTFGTGDRRGHQSKVALRRPIGVSEQVIDDASRCDRSHLEMSMACSLSQT